MLQEEGRDALGVPVLGRAVRADAARPQFREQPRAHPLHPEQNNYNFFSPRRRARRGSARAQCRDDARSEGIWVALDYPRGRSVSQTSGVVNVRA